jgi:ABC-type transport system involved in cytochrome bd biosynthesis fused ATPase/permease subunit
VFLPIRNVGAAFHASTAGLEASRDALDLLYGGVDEPAGAAASARPSEGRAEAGEPAADVAGLRARGLTVLRDGRPVVEGLDLDVAPGEVVALTGASGSGKSSVVAAVLGFADTSGDLRIDGARAGAATRAGVAWAGQAPQLLEGTVAENVRLGCADAPADVLDRALAIAGVDVPSDLSLGPGGTGLSGGQAQRIAVARAVHRALATGARLLVLDEPTSALDAGREAELGAALREFAREGRAVLVTTHRDALAQAADRVVRIPEGARV